MEIFRKYKNFITRVFGLLIVVTLLGCNKVGTNELMKASQFLTATVYNATVSKLENKAFIEKENISIPSSKSNFKYDKIKVFEGYSFTTILDFNLEPYFKNDYKGKEIEVIISIFGLYSKEYDSWYDQQMIIFKTSTEIVGFLRPQSGIIYDLNSFEPELDDLYFQSSMFLTDNEVVKYYEKDDFIYSFDADLSDHSNIKLDISRSIAFKEEEELKSSVISNTLKELDSSEVFDIMELAKIEKIDIKATITEVDIENGLIHVSSQDVKTLKTVKSNYYIYDLDGNSINITDLNEGDIIRIYYYDRYNGYNPVDIIVNDIVVEKVINN